VEDPFRIDEVSKKSSANALLPLDETAASEEQEAQQPVRPQRSLPRDLDPLEDAPRGSSEEGNSSLRSRFSIQGRNNKGKTRAMVGAENPVKNGESPLDLSNNEWMPDETDLFNTNTGNAPATLSTPDGVTVPTLLHGTGSASSSGDGQISSAARRYPSVLVHGEAGDSADDGDNDQAIPHALELPERKARLTASVLATQTSAQAAGAPRQRNPWIGLMAGLAALLIATFAALWLWPAAEEAPDQQPPEVATPNDVGTPTPPAENEIKPP
jgi:hypothetical protein